MKLNPLFVLVALALGLCAGLALGYGLGAFVWPARVTNVDYADLKSATQDDLIVLIADAFATDGNAALARDRLAQFKDPKMTSRVVALAKKYLAANEPSASSLAALAIALGNTDDDIAQLAITRTPTLTPTPTRTLLPTATPTLTATVVAPTGRAASATPTRPRTATPTSAPKPAAIAPTEWLPAFPGEWPPGANFAPVNVAVGQKYWHLARALYCDDRDTRNNCPNLPGGDIGTNIYVLLIGAGGGRESSPLKIVKDDGTLATVGDLGPEKSPDDQCNCNYSFVATHWPIQVAGYPSDSLSGLGLYSVRMGIKQAHTRYYLTFQLLTK
jgi:hypothetical protein